MYDFGQQLGFERVEVQNIAEYLRDEGLLDFVALGGTIAITHAGVREVEAQAVAITQQGVREVEAALERPEQPTPHFPPVNFIYIARMDHSQIQQGTANSTQTVTFGATDLTPIRNFLEELKTQLEGLGISADEQAEARLQVATAEAQLSSKRPNSVIVRESLHSIRNILEGGVGSVAATAFLQQLPQLIALLPK
jgi:hypothetical protein